MLHKLNGMWESQDRAERSTPTPNGSGGRCDTIVISTKHLTTNCVTSTLELQATVLIVPRPSHKNLRPAAVGI